MLLAGGYFRARIPTLSPFDKVVGGICWSITASSVDLGDVDILFTENATIGERMSVFLFPLVRQLPRFLLSVDSLAPPAHPS